MADKERFEPRCCEAICQDIREGRVVIRDTEWVVVSSNGVVEMVFCPHCGVEIRKESRRQRVDGFIEDLREGKVKEGDWILIELVGTKKCKIVEFENKEEGVYRIKAFTSDGYDILNGTFNELDLSLFWARRTQEQQTELKRVSKKENKS